MQKDDFLPKFSNWSYNSSSVAIRGKNEKEQVVKGEEREGREAREGRRGRGKANNERNLRRVGPVPSRRSHFMKDRVPLGGFDIGAKVFI